MFLAFDCLSFYSIEWRDVITTIANFCVSVLLIVYKYVMDCLV